MCSKCDEVQLLIPAWADKQLDRSQMDMVNAHLKICDECAKYSSKQIVIIAGIKDFYTSFDPLKSDKGTVQMSQQCKRDVKAITSGWLNLKFWFKPFAVALGGAFLILFAILFYSQKSPVVYLAKLESSSGIVEYRVSKSSKFMSAKHGLKLMSKTDVRTGSNGKTTIVFKRGATLVLAANSCFELNNGDNIGSQKNGTGIYEVDKQKKPITISTPQGLTCILGTKFRIDVSEEATSLILQKGSIAFKPFLSQKILLKPGERLIVEKNNPLTKLINIKKINIKKYFGDGNIPIVVPTTIISRQASDTNEIQQRMKNTIVTIVKPSDPISPIDPIEAISSATIDNHEDVEAVSETFNAGNEYNSPDSAIDGI